MSSSCRPTRSVVARAVLSGAEQRTGMFIAMVTMATSSPISRQASPVRPSVLASMSTNAVVSLYVSWLLGLPGAAIGSMGW